MSFAGYQTNPNDVNFHLQQILEIFDKGSAEKNLIPKSTGGGKYPPSCQLGLTKAKDISFLFGYKYWWNVIEYANKLAGHLSSWLQK